MVDTRSHCLLRPCGWHQYKDMGGALEDRRIRTNRLVRRGAIEPGHPVTKCGKGRCGMGNKVPRHRTTSPSPFECSAFCRVAQIRLEHKEVPFLGKLLTPFDPAPLMVTLVNPRYWCPVSRLASFNPAAFIQSVQRGLKKCELTLARSIVAVGRVDVDLGVNDQARIVARPHVHLIVAGADEFTLKRCLRPRLDRSKYGSLAPVVVRSVIDRGALRYSLKCQIQGLSNNGDGPVVFKRSRQRANSSSQINFDRFLMRHRICDLLILHGLKRHGSEIVLLSDITKEYWIAKN